MAGDRNTWAERIAASRQRQVLGHGLETLNSEAGGGENPQELSLRRRSQNDREYNLALESLDRLDVGGSLSEDHMASLEAIVEPDNRPVIDIASGTYTEVPWNWRQLGEPAVRARIEAAISAVGRVEIAGNPRIPYGGTAFLVGQGLMMTNRHVAELFSLGLGTRNLTFRPGLRSGIDFKQEVVTSEPELFRLSQVVMVHPYWDCALLQVENITGPHPILKLQADEPETIAGRAVAIIGYPAFDPRNDVDLQRRIFRIFERKRLQPGELTGYESIPSFEQTVDALTHDISTLGGNSGSAVIDLETGDVLGLHFAGVRRRANYAVPGWELARDAHVIDAGVTFTKSPPQRPRAVWQGRWDEVEPPRSAGLAAQRRGDLM